jgi:hypothetical protein
VPSLACASLPVCQRCQHGTTVHRRENTQAKRKYHAACACSAGLICTAQFWFGDGRQALQPCVFPVYSDFCSGMYCIFFGRPTLSRAFAQTGWEVVFRDISLSTSVHPRDRLGSRRRGSHRHRATADAGEGAASEPVLCVRTAQFNIILSETVGLYRKDES